jgi:hypothetical protein
VAIELCDRRSISCFGLEPEAVVFVFDHLAPDALIYSHKVGNRIVKYSTKESSERIYVALLLFPDAKGKLKYSGSQNDEGTPI